MSQPLPLKFTPLMPGGQSTSISFSEHSLKTISETECELKTRIMETTGKSLATVELQCIKLQCFQGLCILLGIVALFGLFTSVEVFIVILVFVFIAEIYAQFRYNKLKKLRDELETIVEEVQK